MAGAAAKKAGVRRKKGIMIYGGIGLAVNLLYFLMHTLSKSATGFTFLSIAGEGRSAHLLYYSAARMNDLSDFNR